MAYLGLGRCSGSQSFSALINKRELLIIIIPAVLGCYENEMIICLMQYKDPEKHLLLSKERALCQHECPGFDSVP